MKVIIGEETLVYSVPVNENTQKWGVYSIPRMWRDVSGKLIIRFNGEIDCGDTDNMHIVPDLYFVSEDDGKTWEQIFDGEQKYPCDILNNIVSPYAKIPEGIIGFREQRDRQPIKDVPSQKEFLLPDGAAVVLSYRYGDIPDECKGMERLLYKNPADGPEIKPVVFDFPEREILINTKGRNEEGEYLEVEQRVKQCIFKNTYFSSVTPLGDGTLVAVTCGQNPDVTDHYSGVAYMIESRDMGLTWRKRSIIASDENMPYGYTGDGHEVSLTMTENGTLLCAMRMEMSMNPDIAKPISDTMVAISKDNGYTWCKPFSVSDSSVTPQIVSFTNGVVAVVYGRPGVHFKYSTDEGNSWSDSCSIIGKTLEEYRKDGVSDGNSKYFDTCSYSNVFVEKISDNSMLILYNNMKYDEGDGIKHKAAFVRTVTFENE